MSGHSVTLRETIAVSSTEINGATAYEVSGMASNLLSVSLEAFLLTAWYHFIHLECEMILIIMYEE